MNLYSKNTWKAGLMAVAILNTIFISCKKEYNPPPEIGAPDIVATITIADLKARYTTVGSVVPIEDDAIIEGIVSCDDKSGNFYQQIAMQDASGGILLRLAGSSHFNNYPVGRKIFVKCKGLYLGSYGRIIQLGGGINEDGDEVTLLAPNLQDLHIVKGPLNQPLVAKVVPVSSLTTSLQDPYINTLIRFENFEFASAELGKKYANEDGSGDRIIVGCNIPSTNRITLRSSNYSNFGSLPVPSGNGEIIGVYSIFNNTKQFTIRDTSDVRFYNSRCGSGPTTVMNISEVRAIYTGSTTSAPAGKRITGIVISNRTTGNINGQNLFIQQGNNLSGITVRFDATHNYNLGDSIDINISGQEISEFKGLLQLNNVPLGNGAIVSTGKIITPRVATAAQINSNFEAWESTLVRINNITSLTGGSNNTWSGSVTLNDGSGTLVVFTLSSASFANSARPSTANSLVGCLGQFDATKQISLRSLSDVQ